MTTLIAEIGYRHYCHSVKVCVYFGFGETQLLKKCPKKIGFGVIIIPIFMHFINEILTGHLVFELVKLPPPNGDEERPEKMLLLQLFQYSDILGIATSVCHQFDVDYNYDDNDDDQTIPRAGGRKGS